MTRRFTINRTRTSQVIVSADVYARHDWSRPRFSPATGDPSCSETYDRRGNDRRDIRFRFPSWGDETLVKGGSIASPPGGIYL